MFHKTEEEKGGRKEEVNYSIFSLEGSVEDYNIMLGKTMCLRKGND